MGRGIWSSKRAIVWALKCSSCSLVIMSLAAEEYGMVIEILIFQNAWVLWVCTWHRYIFRKQCQIFQLFRVFLGEPDGTKWTGKKSAPLERRRVLDKSSSGWSSKELFGIVGVYSVDPRLPAIFLLWLPIRKVLCSYGAPSTVRVRRFIGEDKAICNLRRSYNSPDCHLYIFGEWLISSMSLVFWLVGLPPLIQRVWR